MWQTDRLTDGSAVAYDALFNSIPCYNKVSYSELSRWQVRKQWCIWLLEAGWHWVRFAEWQEKCRTASPTGRRSDHRWPDIRQIILSLTDNFYNVIAYRSPYFSSDNWSKSPPPRNGGHQTPANVSNESFCAQKAWCEALWGDDRLIDGQKNSV